MCECYVDFGGGDVLFIEMNYFICKEVVENKCLVCQVKVCQDMYVCIFEEIFGIKKFDCMVVLNYNVVFFIKEFVVCLLEGEIMDFQFGGYIQIDVLKVIVDYKNIDIQVYFEYYGDDLNKFQSEWDKFKLWDLKMVNDEEQFCVYLMVNYFVEGDIIMLNICIVILFWDCVVNGWMNVNLGVCFFYVFDQKFGDKVMIFGFYGEFFIKLMKKEMVYIGGGVGMVLLCLYFFYLFYILKMIDCKVLFWYGGCICCELFYIEQFCEIEKEFFNFCFYVVLDNLLLEDNWQVKEDMDVFGDGFKGYIMFVVMEQYLNNYLELEEIEYYFCGFLLMNVLVIKVLDELGVFEENILFDDFGG